MLKRNLLLKFSSLILAGTILVGAPAIIPVAQAASGHHDHAHLGNGLSSQDANTIAPAPTVSGSSIISQGIAVKSWAPARPMAGMGSIVFLNSFGSGTPLTIDLQAGAYATDNNGNADTNQFIVSSDGLYAVPQGTNNGMGLMQLALAPGTYSYTASVPNVGTIGGTFDVTAGQVRGLSFYGGNPKTIVENHNRRNDSEHTSTSVVFTQLLVVPQNLTAQAR